MIRGTTLAVGLLVFVAPTLAEYEYALDDGVSTSTAGPSQFSAEMLWGNYFDVEPGYETITSISVSLAGDVPLGRAITLTVLDDPDNDLDPTNAVPVATKTGLTVSAAPNEFITFDIPDTVVSGGFFVTAAMYLAQGEHAPRLDWDSQPGRSWVFFDDEINYYNLGGSPLYYNMASSPFNGTWLLRAQAVPEPGTALSMFTVLMLALTRRR